MKELEATLRRENKEIVEPDDYASDVSTNGTGAYAEAAAVIAVDAATITADAAADAVAAADKVVGAVAAADPTLTTAAATIAAAAATTAATVVTSEAAADAVAAADIVVDAISDATITASNALAESEVLRDRQEVFGRTDMLTELENQSAFFYDLNNQLKILARYQHPAALVVIDVDDFKSVNDNLGHVGGNRLLKMIGLGIAQSIRTSDMAGRIGGDEFAILFPETVPDIAKNVVENLLIALHKAMKAEFSDVTFSVGIAGYHNVPDHYEDMIKDADQLMYEVKNTGKNAVKLKIIN